MKYSSPYKHPDWQKLRALVFERDHGVCQLRLSRKCLGDTQLTLRKNDTDGRTAHCGHIIDWRTNGGSWIDPANLRLECGPCSRAESASRKRREGWKHSDTHIVLVSCPPFHPAGPQHAAVNAGPKDLVIDFEGICAGLGYPDRHRRPDAVVKAANDQRTSLLREVQKGESGAETVWLVSTRPDAVEHYDNHHELVTLTPDPEEFDDFDLTDTEQALVDAWYGAALTQEW